MRTRTRNLLAVAAAAASVTLSATGALGAHAAQSAYINPDTGKASENPDVAAGSSCESPDTVDVQPIGSFSSGANNVHVDGCIYDAANNLLDTTVSFEYDGVGGIFACPDADGEGPKTASTQDSDLDGRIDLCTHSGYEDDNQQYHVRVLSDVPGAATVTMCTDPEGNGCGDADMTSVIQLSFTGALPQTGGGLVLLGGAALTGAGMLGLRRKR